MVQPMADRHVYILGIRGVPAAHGGFETFAERLAIWLRDRGWRVTVYCQADGATAVSESDWEGIHRVHIPATLDGPMGTIQFDARCAADCLKRDGVLLTLGYNTGFLSAWLRLKGRTNVINMDGIEWKRAKYSRFAKAYLWVNERLAAWAGQRLIADHPIIGDHLATRTKRERIVVIPYGADRIDAAPTAPLAPLGLEPGKFLTLIARPEPENSILEAVTAFSARPRGVKLVVLGKYNPSHAYQAQVLDAAGDEVVMPGAIYDREAVDALRFHSLAYVHGHQVGGTNPSLVEALGAGNAVLARDNRFNRWVAGDAGLYFADVDGFARVLDQLLSDDALRQKLSRAARARWEEAFTWPRILADYEQLLAATADAEGMKA